MYKDPIIVFTSVWLLSSLGGLAALLRSEGKLNRRIVASAVLTSGIFGVVVAMFLYESLPVWKLVGVSALAGFGGTTLLDFLFALAKKLCLPEKGRYD